MKALTICQPYAALICLPESDPRHKRVENRTWSTNYRGPLALHAGRSRTWLRLDAAGEVDVDYQLRVADLPFGAVVAVVQLVDCIRLSITQTGRDRFPADALQQYPWLAEHRHAEGPFCWILSDVCPLATPIPWKGAQGLWSLPEAVLSGGRL